MAVTELSDVVMAFEKAKIGRTSVSQIKEPRSLQVEVADVEKKDEGKVVKGAFSVLYDTMGVGTVGAKYDEGAKRLTINYDLSGRPFLGVPGCGESMAYRP